MNDGIFEDIWYDEVQVAESRSYSPYSNFKVGAVLITDDGTIIHGANIENAAYSPTICAERSALVSAYSQGYTKFKAIVVYTNADTPSSPCGVCRQVLKELTHDDMPVYMTNHKSDFIKKTVDELLPLGFSGRDLNG